MTNDMRIRVGGNAWDDGAAFLAAIRASDEGEERSARILAFESWEALAAILTKSRLDLLRHLRESPATSINQLALALGRPYRRVHGDVTVLETAGLIERAPDCSLRVLVDAIQAELRLDRRPEMAKA